MKRGADSAGAVSGQTSVPLVALSGRLTCLWRDFSLAGRHHCEEAEAQESRWVVTEKQSCRLPEAQSWVQVPF